MMIDSTLDLFCEHDDAEYADEFAMEIEEKAAERGADKDATRRPFCCQINSLLSQEKPGEADNFAALVI